VLPPLTLHPYTHRMFAEAGPEIVNIEQRFRHAPDWIVLTIACLAQFMVVLDVSIVTVALPSMQRDLHFSSSSAEWVVNAYVLTFAGFLLLGGRMADIVGRRRVYIAGMSIFVLASIAAGLAHNGAQIVTVRAIQGVGGAILSPATLTIIVTTFQGPRLPKAIGAWSAVAGAGGAVGGLLSGLLTGYASWRWIFFINVPVGAVAIVAALLYLREIRNRGAATKLDVTGAVLVTGSLAAVIYAIVKTAHWGWGSHSTLSWLFGGAVGLAIFLVWESKVASHPLVPFRVFKTRSLTLANLMMLLIGGVFFAMWYFLTFYFQNILGFDAVRAGLAFLPMSLSVIVGAQVGSRVLARTGVRPLLMAGATLGALGFLWISRIQSHSSYLGAIVAPAVICAFAMGVLFTSLATAATSGIDRSEAGLASGLLNTSRQVGGSLALAALGTAAVDRSASFANPSSAQALVSGYERAFQFSAAVAAVALLASLAVPRLSAPSDQH